MFKTAAGALAGVVALVAVTSGEAQIADHLKCYKIKDPLKRAGTADLDTPQFGVDPGCKITSAKFFCVPATKTNVAVIDKVTKQPITPLPVSGSDPGDRICYKVKCEQAVADQQVTDQFGTRTLGKLKASLVCTPAVKGGAPVTTTTTSISTSSTSTTSTTLPTGCGVYPTCGGSCEDGLFCQAVLDGYRAGVPEGEHCVCVPATRSCAEQCPQPHGENPTAVEDAGICAAGEVCVVFTRPVVGQDCGCVSPPICYATDPFEGAGCAVGNCPSGSPCGICGFTNCFSCGCGTPGGPLPE